MELSDPERTLAIAYAPRATRAALTALFALDERFGAIVATTTEPMIGLMRLTWWREALERLDHGSAPAEPLLQLIRTLILPFGIGGGAIGAIDDGWAALLEVELGDAEIARHGRERGRRLFAAAAMILGSDDDRLALAGEGWALADLAHRHSVPAVRAMARAQGRAVFAQLSSAPWPLRARPLAMLALLARSDVTGAGPRAQGSPARIARMLALRLTGR